MDQDRLGVEVGFGPGDFVLAGDPALPKKGLTVEPPTFGPRLLAKRLHAWIKMPVGTEIGIGLRDIVLDGNPATPPLKGHTPNLGPMSLVAKRLD